MVLAAALRLLAFDQVVGADGVRFLGNDPHYHARLIELQVESFPRIPRWDPYLSHPGGGLIAVGPLFDVLVAGAAEVMGLGRPSARLVELSTALAPVALGALCVVPAYGLGFLLGGRLGAAVAALLLAVLPGRLLERSLIGFSDHHVAEVLFSAVLIWALVAASETASRSRREGTAGALAGWSVLAGLAWAAYLLTWVMGWISAAPLALWAGFVFVAGEQRRSSRTLFLLAGTAAVAAAACAPLVDGVRVGVRQTMAPALVAIFALLLGIASGRGRIAKWGRWGRLGVVTCLVVAGLGVVVVLSPETMRSIWSQWRASGGAGAGTIGEAVPFFVGGLSWLPLWINYATATVSAVAGAVVLGRRLWRRPSPPALLFISWSAAVGGLTLFQNRFSYYFALVVAVLSGVAAESVWQWMVRRATRSRPAPAAFVAATIGFVIVLGAPGARIAIGQARSPATMPPAWTEALGWMREATPAPFAEGDRLYETSFSRRPATAAAPVARYGVLSWWDYGYWIVHEAHRVPFANPTQRGASDAAAIFLDDRPDRALARATELGLRYLVVDTEMALSQPSAGLAHGKLPAMLRWLGVRSDRYYDLFELALPGRPVSRLFLFYPDYFRTLLVRLVAFGGVAVDPQTVLVATVEPPAAERGLQRVTALRRLPSLEAAERYAAADPRRRIVSADPYLSCVPLAPVGGVSELFRSQQIAIERGLERVPRVRIFALESPGRRW